MVSNKTPPDKPDKPDEIGVESKSATPLEVDGNPVPATDKTILDVFYTLPSEEKNKLLKALLQALR